MQLSPTFVGDTNAPFDMSRVASRINNPLPSDWDDHVLDFLRSSKHAGTSYQSALLALALVVTALPSGVRRKCVLPRNLRNFHVLKISECTGLPPDALFTSLFEQPLQQVAKTLQTSSLCSDVR